MKVKLNEATTHCYSVSDPCFMCPPDVILRAQLTVEEIPGYEATVAGYGRSRDGFVCASCVVVLRNDKDITVEYGTQWTQSLTLKHKEK